MLTSPNSYRRWTLLLLMASVSVATSLRAQTTTTGNLLTNPGAEQGTGTGPGTVTNWAVGGNSNPGRDDGTEDPGINPHTGSYDFFGNFGTGGTLTQRVDLLSAGISAPALQAGGNTATFSFYEQSLDQSTVDATDTAGVNLSFFNSAGTQIGTATSGQFGSVGAWSLETTTAAIPVGTRYIDYQITFVRNAGNYLDSFVDDTSLTVNVVPEPSTWITGLGCGGLLALALRRRAVAR